MYDNVTNATLRNRLPSSKYCSKSVSTTQTVLSLTMTSLVPFARCGHVDQTHRRRSLAPLAFGVLGLWVGPCSSTLLS